DADERYVNRFAAVARDAPWAPPWDPSLDLPALPLMTASVMGVEGVPVWCDELGRVKVQFHGLDAEDHAHAGGAGTNGNAGDGAWVRVNGLWCGSGFGVVFPLRPGMEVSIGFEMGDPSRPVILGSRHHASNVAPRFDGLIGLPHNHGLSGIVTRELGGSRGQQLRFNDSPRGFSAQLASDHAASQLNLGDLATPMRQGRTTPRGEGFELRSDAAGAIRTAKALLLSAWARMDASGNQLDAREHVALMQECLELFRSLGRYAAQHQGQAADEAGQEKLLADVKGAPAGSNVDPHGQGGAPTLSLTAPAGIAATTPKTILSYAGVSIDSVAQQHLQWTAGQRISAHAGQGIAWFAQHGGISAIAHHGTWLMQSQHGNIEANAAQNIRWTATSGQLVGMARKIMLVAEDGSFVQIGEGGITLGTKGAITHKSASFAQNAPATLGTDLPTFSQGMADQRFVLRYGGHDGPVAAQRRFEIRLSDGSVVTGTSDAEGRTEVLQRDAMHIAHIRILSND
ncbi:DUF2345 domain-containing protein, partial [Azohydromonas aeria]|uniref:DUF2345 domain-containing protein n=1 Tax=Azohydromonas aeria TaxID=2590212 RepID=UPI0012FB3536